MARQQNSKTTSNTNIITEGVELPEENPSAESLDETSTKSEEGAGVVEGTMTPEPSSDDAGADGEEEESNNPDEPAIPFVITFKLPTFRSEGIIGEPQTAGFYFSKFAEKGKIRTFYGPVLDRFHAMLFNAAHAGFNPDHPASAAMIDFFTQEQLDARILRPREYDATRFNFLHPNCALYKAADANYSQVLLAVAASTPERHFFHAAPVVDAVAPTAPAAEAEPVPVTEEPAPVAEQTAE